MTIDLKTEAFRNKCHLNQLSLA